MAIDVPETVRQLGDSASGAPVMATLVSAVVYVALAGAFVSVVQACAPGNFKATARLHAWVAAFGVVLTLGIVALANWPLPGYIDSGYASIAVRLVAIFGFLLAGGIPLRRVLGRRQLWVQNKIKELQQDRG